MMEHPERGLLISVWQILLLLWLLGTLVGMLAGETGLRFMRIAGPVCGAVIIISFAWNLPRRIKAAQQTSKYGDPEVQRRLSRMSVIRAVSGDVEGAAFCLMFIVSGLRVPGSPWYLAASLALFIVFVVAAAVNLWAQSAYKRVLMHGIQ